MRTDFFEFFDFSGKTACVTGAASGIGRATALLFAQLGASVYAADRDDKKVAELSLHHPSIRPVCFDQSDNASIEQLAVTVGTVDILINNAGILSCSTILELDWEEMSRVVHVNLLGAIMLSKLLGGRMVQRGSGSIVLLGSQAAFAGSAARGIYAASKAAIMQFTRTAALEWAESAVRVNCIAPGKTLTGMNQHIFDTDEAKRKGLADVPLGRYAQPEDIARSIVFLASDASSFTTGQTLVVDGGWVLT